MASSPPSRLAPCCDQQPGPSWARRPSKDWQQRGPSWRVVGGAVPGSLSKGVGSASCALLEQ
eukprot:9552790-Lingulodinium_polyedra.AAC.1